MPTPAQSLQEMLDKQKALREALLNASQKQPSNIVPPTPDGTELPAPPHPEPPK